MEDQLDSGAVAGPARSRVVDLIAAILVLAAAIGLGIAVAGGLVQPPWLAAGPTSTATAHETPASTARATSTAAAPSAPQVVDAPSGVLPDGSTVTILDGPVEIRSGADPSSALVGSAPSGTHLAIGFPSPLVVNGAFWYAVEVVGDHATAGYAALNPTDGSVTVDPVTCPPPASSTTGEATLAAISGIVGRWDGLACLGETELTVEGAEVTSGIGGTAPGAWQPGWLAYPWPGLVLAPQGGGGPTVGIHLPPSIVLPSPDPALPTGQVPLIRVTGHFDDAAAASCTVTQVPLGETPTSGPFASVDPEHAVVYCREQFVADSLTVIGSVRDPLAP